MDQRVDLSGYSAVYPCSTHCFNWTKRNEISHCLVYFQVLFVLCVEESYVYKCASCQSPVRQVLRLSCVKHGRQSWQRTGDSDRFLPCADLLVTNRTAAVLRQVNSQVSFRLARLDHQTHSRLLNHLLNLTSSSYHINSFVLTVFWGHCFVCNRLCAPIWRNST